MEKRRNNKRIIKTTTHERVQCHHLHRQIEIATSFFSFLSFDDFLNQSRWSVAHGHLPGIFGIFFFLAILVSRQRRHPRAI
jgi:hypothetical protein